MTPYEVLGVAPDADAAEVHRAYVALARQHHPDRSGGDDARMRAINDAWATVGDPVRRRQYDELHLLRRRPGPPDQRYDVTDDIDDIEPDDLGDDRPVRITVVLPRWAAMLPTGLFAASIVLLGGGMVFGPALVALAMMAFLLSALLFLASPFIALYASRRQKP